MSTRTTHVVSATPYRWPFHGTLDPTRTALVVCCDRSWRPARADAGNAEVALVKLREATAAAGIAAIELVTLRPVRRRAGYGALPRAGDAADPPECHSDTLARIHANGISGFHGSGLDELLRSLALSDLIFAGWGLEGPVHSTVRAANDRGYECLIVGDACAPQDPTLAFSALSMVRYSGGIFGAFANVADVIDALGSTPQEERCPRPIRHRR